MKILPKKFLSKKILSISSGGGHLSEIMNALSDDSLSGMNVIYVTYKKKHLKSTLKGKQFHFILDPHTSRFKYIVNAFQSLFLLVLYRPRVVVSTGAGIAIPMIFFAHFMGAKIIFIETGARITTPSRSGLFAYKYSDLFIVQHVPLLAYYSNAVIGSDK